MRRRSTRAPPTSCSSRRTSTPVLGRLSRAPAPAAVGGVAPVRARGRRRARPLRVGARRGAVLRRSTAAASLTTVGVSEVDLRAARPTCAYNSSRVETGPPATAGHADRHRATVVSTAKTMRVGPPSVRGDDATLEVASALVASRPDFWTRPTWTRRCCGSSATSAIPATLPVAPAGRGLTQRQRQRRGTSASRSPVPGFVEVIVQPVRGGSQSSTRFVPSGVTTPRRLFVRSGSRTRISDRQPLMRTTLLPGLLATLRPQRRAAPSPDLALFETGLVLTLVLDHDLPRTCRAWRSTGSTECRRALLAADRGGPPAQPRRPCGGGARATT